MKQQTTLLLGIGIALIVPLLFLTTILSPFAIFYHRRIYINDERVDWFWVHEHADVEDDDETPLPPHLHVDGYRITVLVEYRPRFEGSDKEGDPLYDEWGFYVIVATHRAGGYEKRYDLSVTNTDGSNADFIGDIDLLDFKHDAEQRQLTHAWEDHDTFWVEVWRAWSPHEDKRTAKAWVTVGEPLDGGDDEPLPDNGDYDEVPTSIIYADHEGINPQFLIACISILPVSVGLVYLAIRRFH